MRAACLLLLSTVTLALPATAALNIDVSSDVSSLENLAPGQEFTLTIELSTTTAAEAYGLSLFAAGWGEGDLDFVSATIPNFGGAASPNGAIFGLEIAPGVVISGINNTLLGPIDNGTSVHLFSGLSPSGAEGAGPDSFTLTLLANRGSGVIEIGAIEELGGDYNGSNPTVSVPYLVAVPEPGTALLVGLGLAALAVTRRHAA